MLPYLELRKIYFFVGKKEFFYNAKTKEDEVNLFKEIIDRLIFQK